MRGLRLAACLVIAIGLAGCALMPKPPETVLVAGATGRVGSAVRLALRDAGYEVPAMTRSAARAAEKHGADWAWVEADVGDPAAIARAMAGADFVISAIGADQPDGPNGPEFVDFLGVRNLATAARNAGIEHFVLVSSAAAGPYRKRSTMIEVGNVRYWKTQGELAVKSSGLDYTIIGPGGLLDEPAPGRGVRLLQRRDYDTGELAIETLAAIAVNALDNPDARNKTFAAIHDDAVADGAWRDMLPALPVDTETEEDYRRESARDERAVFTPTSR